MIVKLLGYAPDADPTLVGVLTNCSAVVPSLKGVKGAPSASVTPLAALVSTCQGAAVLAKLDGTTRLFAGTGAKIYEGASSVWTDVSRAAAYTGNSTQRWRFAQTGEVSLAANGADTMQASVSSGAFSCIPGSPLAAIVETVGSFVFAFNTSTNPNGWHCAAIGGYTSWTTSVATQAASGTLTATPGPVLAGKKFGSSIVAYKKASMYLGVYVGPPNIWEFNQIPGAIGAMSQEAVTNIGTPENPKHIFMGEDDFYVFDGSKPVPIGSDRVKVQVFGSLLQARFYACAAQHDRKNSLVYFHYPVADQASPDKCVVYNYRTNQWGVDDRTIEIPMEYQAVGITYDQLGSSYATYEDFPVAPYDQAFLSTAQLVPAVFGPDHILRTLTGVSGTTSFTTGDLGDDERMFCVTRIRPRFITKPNSATWTHSYRNNTGDTLTADAAVAISTGGSFDLLREARWHRGTMEMTGDWEMAVLNAEGEAGGLE